MRRNQAASVAADTTLPQKSMVKFRQFSERGRRNCHHGAQAPDGVDRLVPVWTNQNPSGFQPDDRRPAREYS
jgi:hypothetical protein